MTEEFSKKLNALACLGTCCILIAAYIFQYYYTELPCPLCLLQRFGFLAVAFGFLLNAYDKPRPFHYAIIIFSALLTAAIAMRQILIHIVPNTGAYGSAIFGLHLYTWSFLAASAIMFGVAVLLLNNYQFSSLSVHMRRKPGAGARMLFLLVMLLAIANSATTFEICGFRVCPDNPTHTR